MHCQCIEVQLIFVLIEFCNPAELITSNIGLAKKFIQF